MTRQNASNAQSSSIDDSVSGAVSSAGRGKVIVVDEHTPIRPAKRPRQSNSDTPRRTSARLAENSAITKRSNPQRFSRSVRATAAASRERVNNDDDDDDDEISDSSSDHELPTSIRIKSPNVDMGKSFVHQNVFDAYFAATSKPSRTSNNVFSQLVPPLSPDEHARLLRTSSVASKNSTALAEVRKAHEALFPRYALELSEGFNLLFFGFGSKRTILNTFVRTVCSRRGHVVVVNAFQPRVGIRDLLGCVEQVPGLTDMPLALSIPEAQARRIYDFFLPPAVRPGQPAASRPLFLLIHNIDAPAMRSPRAKAALALLAMNPRIHVIASIDHVHAQTLWSTAEATARKHEYMQGDGSEVPPTRGFAWAWHDLTTMEHYDAELAHVDASRLSGRTAKTTSANTERGMTETAAQHILASVNAKAKKLFALLARTQLESLQSAPKSEQVSYNFLFNAARADFIATNDTSFKALLAEFHDHKLVISNLTSGGETLGIPLSSEELRRLVQWLSEES